MSARHGTVAPKGMKWKTAEVERILAPSKAVLGLLPTLIGIEKLPNGATLQQVLKPPVFLRWTAERQQYLGDSLRLEH